MRVIVEGWQAGYARIGAPVVVFCYRPLPPSPLFPHGAACHMDKDHDGMCSYPAPHACCHDAPGARKDVTDAR